MTIGHRLHPSQTQILNNADHLGDRCETVLRYVLYPGREKLIAPCEVSAYD